MAGIEAVVVNAHHLHGQLIAAVKNKNWPIPLHVQVEPALLGTGGGLANVLPFFEGQPFLVVNGDILCDVPLQGLIGQYLNSGAAAALLMHDNPEFNKVAVDAQGRILGFGNEAGGPPHQDFVNERLAFTGIHVIHPSVLDGFPPGRPGDVLTAYRNLIRTGEPPLALRMPDFFWREMGSVESYRKLHEELGGLKENAIFPVPTGKGVVLDPEAEIAPDAHLRGYISVGRGSRVMNRVELENTILWNDVEIQPGCKLRNCIVTDGAVVGGEHESEILTGSRS
jgi:NDP-sugar pyrophosphorylase family protein